MKIFVCGGSAVGKTTFVNKMVKKYKFQKADEIIRNFPFGWFKEYSLMHRETLFLLGQILKEQKKEKEITIYDRSLIDVIAWMVDDYDKLLFQFVADNFIKKGDLYIITPLETKKWLLENWKEYREDKIRWTCMTTKLLEFFKLNEPRNFYDDRKHSFIRDYIRFMEFERFVMEEILEKAKAKYYVCKELKGYKWQEEAEKEIIKYLKERKISYEN